MLCNGTGGYPFWLYLQLLQLARAEDLIGVDLVEVVGGDETGGRRHGEVKGRGQLLQGRGSGSARRLLRGQLLLLLEIPKSLLVAAAGC